MNAVLQFLRSATGQLVMVGTLAAVGITAVAWHRQQRSSLPPASSLTTPASLPKVFERSGAKFQPPSSHPPITPPSPEEKVKASSPPTVLPLTLFIHTAPMEKNVPSPKIPLGRLIPCETVFALESHRLDTPVIALVTEDVWQQGQLIVPAGSEIHGQATLDSTRERIVAQGQWTLIRTTQPCVQISGIALERSREETGPLQGAAGLTGAVLRTNRGKKARLFAATFLATATTALQTTRTTPGLFGDTLTPAATTRNATLAGTSAVLKDYAQQLRDAVAEDGIYIHVPAGHPFYLYVTSSRMPSVSPLAKEDAAL